MLPMADGFKDINEARNKVFKSYFPLYKIELESHDFILFLNTWDKNYLGYYIIVKDLSGFFNLYYLDKDEYNEKLSSILKEKLIDLVS